MIRRIAKEGIGYGIFLMVTAGGFGTSEIPSRLADSFRTTICLEMSDAYQYGDVMRVVKVPVFPEGNVKRAGINISRGENHRIPDGSCVRRRKRL